jgi:hypothetical protein
MPVAVALWATPARAEPCDKTGNVKGALIVGGAALFATGYALSAWMGSKLDNPVGYVPYAGPLSNAFVKYPHSPVGGELLALVRGVMILLGVEVTAMEIGGMVFVVAGAKRPLCPDTTTTTAPASAPGIVGLTATF